ncbi:hypothetical protein [uncultured Desulfovibrio sp.]|uniref:hypothetical protein n=1 Tax=uncultured Desulfovibrio sp. TaxID=167968 RepID=UPI0003A5587F|nr:hypothetical protein [uncultured Desulfovibrio sp.]
MMLRRDADGILAPEFISDGFAAMTGMALEQAYALSWIRRQMDRAGFFCETVYRLRKGEHGYTWVKNRSALILD